MSRKTQKSQQASRTSEGTLVAPDQRDDVEVNEESAETAESEHVPLPMLEITPVTLEVPTVKHTNRRPCRYPTVKLTPQAADKLHALFLGLQAKGETVYGRPVERHPDALRWLLENAVP